MKRYPAAVSLLFAVLGCCGPTFTDLGNGVGVPSESIDKYAASHGISREEARAQMRVDSDTKRIQEHAEKYGLAYEQAQQQLQHAGQVDLDR